MGNVKVAYDYYYEYRDLIDQYQVNNQSIIPSTDVI